MNDDYDKFKRKINPFSKNIRLPTFETFYTESDYPLPQQQQQLYSSLTQSPSLTSSWYQLGSNTPKTPMLCKTPRRHIMSKSNTDQIQTPSIVMKYKKGNSCLDGEQHVQMQQQQHGMGNITRDSMEGNNEKTMVNQRKNEGSNVTVGQSNIFRINKTRTKLMEFINSQPLSTQKGFLTDNFTDTSQKISNPSTDAEESSSYITTTIATTTTPTNPNINDQTTTITMAKKSKFYCISTKNFMSPKSHQVNNQTINTNPKMVITPTLLNSQYIMDAKVKKKLNIGFVETKDVHDFNEILLFGEGTMNDKEECGKIVKDPLEEYYKFKPLSIDDYQKLTTEKLTIHKIRFTNAIRRLILLIKCLRNTHLTIDEIFDNDFKIFSLRPYSKKLSRRLFEIINKGDTLQATKLLSRTKSSRYYLYDINEVGQTALHLAVKQNNLSLVKLITAFGCYVDAQDTMRKTPLYYAIANKSFDIVKHLLYTGCSPWSPSHSHYAYIELCGDEMSYIKLIKKARLAHLGLLITLPSQRKQYWLKHANKIFE